MTFNCWYYKLVIISHYDTYVYLDTAQLIVVIMTNKMKFVTFVELRSIPK